jgi:pyruvyltransferase
MRKIKVFSASVGRRFGETPENFGDNLMHHLLREVYELDVEYVRHAQAELLGVGSVLDSYYRRKGGRPVPPFRRRPWRTMHVWGSGFMSSSSKPIWPQSVKYCAVRGPLSRDRLAGDPKTIALGDPALLLPQIWPAKAEKLYKVLIAPHFATRSALLARYGEQLPAHWGVLDLLEEPEEITRKIASAEFVVSSSLHGLIVADAYNVPSCWMEPHAPIRGDGFKFADYGAQRGKDLQPPVGLEDILDQTIDFEDQRYQAAPPTDQTISTLIASFPFR